MAEFIINEKIYNCPECNELLTFDIGEYNKKPSSPMPFYCKKCKKYFGWAKGKEQEAFDFLKQRLVIQTYKKEEWCYNCQGTGNLKNFTGDFNECPECEGFGVVGEAKEKERIIEEKEKLEQKKPKGKGIKIDGRVSREMRRLGAKGLSVKDGQIVYKIPKEVREQKNKEFLKKKKARKLAKKSRKKKR